VSLSCIGDPRPFIKLSVKVRLHKSPRSIENVVNPDIVQKLFTAGRHSFSYTGSDQLLVPLTVVVDVVLLPVCVFKFLVACSHPPKYQHILLVDRDCVTVVPHLLGTLSYVISAASRRALISIGLWP